MSDRGDRNTFQEKEVGILGAGHQGTAEGSNWYLLLSGPLLLIAVYCLQKSPPSDQLKWLSDEWSFSVEGNFQGAKEEHWARSCVLWTVNQTQLQALYDAQSLPGPQLTQTPSSIFGVWTSSLSQDLVFPSFKQDATSQSVGSMWKHTSDWNTVCVVSFDFSTSFLKGVTLYLLTLDVVVKVEKGVPRRGCVALLSSPPYCVSGSSMSMCRSLLSSFLCSLPTTACKSYGRQGLHLLRSSCARWTGGKRSTLNISSCSWKC